MNYFLLKLAFDTAVHFGGSDSAVGSQSSALTLRADTIFSALCHTALEVYGEPALEELLVSADADALRISDAMPWRGDTFYLPKPIAASTSPAELSTVERKAVKKLAWIPASKFDRYTASLHSGTYPLDELDQSFGQAYEQTKASVTDGADAKPYFVGLYRLHAGCGLYVLCACEGNDQLKMLKAFADTQMSSSWPGAAALPPPNGWRPPSRSRPSIFSPPVPCCSTPIRVSSAMLASGSRIRFTAIPNRCLWG